MEALSAESPKIFSIALKRPACIRMVKLDLVIANLILRTVANGTHDIVELAPAIANLALGQGTRPDAPPAQK